jgi:TRAP-type mannitol/chloroaromatic compound transport system permease large subunit
MAGLFIAYVVIITKINPKLAPVVTDEELNMPFIEKLKLARAGIIPFLIFFSMMGLFVMGVLSLVESSVFGAVAATLAAALKRRLNFKTIHQIAHKTMSVSAMFLWLILAALAFGAIFDGLGASRAIESLFINDWGLDRWQIMIMIMASFIVLGMFLDDTAMLVIVAPLYIPLVKALEFNLIWFGILYTITCQIAYITPPFGYNLFLMRSMAPKEITLTDIYRSITPFLLIMVLTIVLLMIFPEIALWLPSQIYTKG